MIDWSAAALMLMYMGGGEAILGAHEPLQFAQMSIRRQIIIRVPVRVRKAAPDAPKVEWTESRGPDCVEAKSIAGAALLGQNSVDLLLRDSSRIRAKLENSCPALDYYYGFYISPNADGRICADRDVIRSRMGGQCEIDSFRRLRPAPRG
ncbi:hypothetical protein [Allosphingosinicella sp.]|uniref:hypothetical protein n=1 Tax=Allosphingosinicella sp. TaxID=2823234 RepID=UPI002FC1ECE1